MTKEHFLQALNEQLQKLPNDERQEILRDYEEYFEAAKLEGKSDAEVLASLGSPKQIAKELLATYYVEELEKSPSTSNIFRAMWAGIGLGFLNIVFVLGPFVGIVGVLFGFWIAAFSLVVSPLLVLAGVAFTAATFSPFDFFVSLTFCGIGILVSIGCLYLTNVFKKWSIRYLKFNISIVKGDTSNA